MAAGCLGVLRIRVVEKANDQILSGKRFSKDAKSFWIYYSRLRVLAIFTQAELCLTGSAHP